MQSGYGRLQHECGKFFQGIGVPDRLTSLQDNPAAVAVFLKAVPWCRSLRVVRRRLKAAFHIPQEELHSSPEVVCRSLMEVAHHNSQSVRVRFD